MSWESPALSFPTGLPRIKDLVPHGVTATSKRRVFGDVFFAKPCKTWLLAQAKSSVQGDLRISENPD